MQAYSVSDPTDDFSRRDEGAGGGHGMATHEQFQALLNRAPTPKINPIAVEAPNPFIPPPETKVSRGGTLRRLISPHSRTSARLATVSRRAGGQAISARRWSGGAAGFFRCDCHDATGLPHRR